MYSGVLVAVWGSCGVRRNVNEKSFAVLALAIEQPSWRYEIGDRFNARFGAIHDVQRSYIYEIVRQLVEDRLLEESDEIGDGRRRGPVFRATPAGIAAFDHWFRETPISTRVQLGLRLAVARDAESALVVLAKYEATCRHEIASLAQPGASACIGNELYHESERAILRACLVWIEQARQRLRHHAGGGA